MDNKIVSLTQKLVRIKSEPSRAHDLEKALEVALVPLKEFTIEKFEKEGCKSALVYNTPKRPKKFKVLLNGHLDIIPGKENQYTPRIKGNRLYGVATMDMKAGLATQILVFKELAKKVSYPMGIQMVTDEEIGGFNGTKYQIDEGIRADFVIVGEATQLDIENKAKGILWAKVSTKGKTAHGAYPWKGENAIRKMQNFLNNLNKKFPELKEERWVTTVNVGTIETSNKTFNKIPDYCEVGLDIRYIPEDTTTIIGTIKSLLPKGFTLEVLVKEPALSTDEQNPYVQALKMEIEKITKKDAKVLSANGSSDVRHFTRVNIPGVEFGPIAGGMGSDNEWVDIKGLQKYYDILKAFLLSLN